MECKAFKLYLLIEIVNPLYVQLQVLSQDQHQLTTRECQRIGLHEEYCPLLRRGDLCLDSSITAAVSATACGVVTHSDLPYTENFDNSLNGCTSFIDHSDWQGDHITPAYYRGTSGKSLYLTADNDSVPFFFILPRIDTTARVALSFWSRCTHHDFNKFTVGLMTDPSDTSTFTPVQTVYPTVDNDWEEIRVSLGYYAGSSLHPAIRFGAHGGEHAWTVNVDDITLIEDLSCLPPDSVTLLAVTDTTATLLVHDPRGAGHYRIRMAGDSADYFSDTILLTGLTHATDYTLSLSAVCTGGAATSKISIPPRRPGCPTAGKWSTLPLSVRVSTPTTTANTS